MALSINTNISALNSTRKLMNSTNALSKTFERLASGLRVNGAKDDAAGLAIATRMTAQVRGMNMAIRNTNDGISMMQVAEGALDETTNALQRVRELGIQARNGTLTDNDRASLQLEVTELISEINRIATSTKFNGEVMLANGMTKVFQVGADSGNTLTVTFDDADTTDLGVNATTVATSAGASAAIVSVDAALDSVSDIRAKLGAYQNRFESTIANLSNISENTSAARSRIMDADIATETANLTRNSIMQQAGTSILAQANQQPQIALRLLG